MALGLKFSMLSRNFPSLDEKKLDNAIKQLYTYKSILTIEYFKWKERGGEKLY